MAVDGWDPFPADALEANRAGALTADQQRHFGGVSRALRGTARGNLGVILVAAAVSLVGVARLARVRQWSSASAPVALAAAVIVIASFLIVRTLANSAALARDLRHVRVQSAEGAIGKRLGPYVSSRVWRPHYLDVGDQRFIASPTAYNAAPESGFVRVYFLPHSRRVVNLERLPDRQFAHGTTPQDLARSFLGAVRSGSRVEMNELRAMSPFGQRAAPPPGDRDRRPLAEAILGTWSSPVMTVAFTPDGNVTATMLGGMQRQGRWSVDGSGRLRADITGEQEAADAWVAGEQLTISLDGRSLTFTRTRDA